MREINVIFAGFGGQGVLTAGLILAHMGVEAGQEVLWSPAYGGEMRGGKAYSMVKLSDCPILDPACEALDVLVAMNGPALDFCCRLVSGGILIVNDIVSPDRIPNTDGQLYRVPLQQLADSAGNPRGANLAAVGCVAAALDLFRRADAESSVRHFFEKKGKSSLGNSASAAFAAGYDYCCERSQ